MAAWQQVSTAHAAITHHFTESRHLGGISGESRQKRRNATLTGRKTDDCRARSGIEARAHLSQARTIGCSSYSSGKVGGVRAHLSLARTVHKAVTLPGHQLWFNRVHEWRCLTGSLSADRSRPTQNSLARSHCFLSLSWPGKKPFLFRRLKAYQLFTSLVWRWVKAQLVNASVGKHNQPSCPKCHLMSLVRLQYVSFARRH